MPIPVLHADVFNSIMLTLTVDQRRIVLPRVVVGYKARFTLAVVIPAYMYVLTHARTTLGFRTESDSPALAHQSSISLVDVGVNYRTRCHDQRLCR